jgi:hypothetical protein
MIWRGIPSWTWKSFSMSSIYKSLTNWYSKWSTGSTLTASLKCIDALVGATRLYTRTIAMHPPPTQCWRYEYRSWPCTPWTTLYSVMFNTCALLADNRQIAVKEAIPYEEFRQNPDTILLTTSMGGHLCWFESGGSRWYCKPVCVLTDLCRPR